MEWSGGGEESAAVVRRAKGARECLRAHAHVRVRAGRCVLERLG